MTLAVERGGSERRLQWDVERASSEQHHQLYLQPRSPEPRDSDSSSRPRTISADRFASTSASTSASASAPPPQPPPPPHLRLQSLPPSQPPPPILPTPPPPHHSHRQHHSHHHHHRRRHRRHRCLSRSHAQGRAHTCACGPKTGQSRTRESLRAAVAVTARTVRWPEKSLVSEAAVAPAASR